MQRRKELTPPFRLDRFPIQGHALGGTTSRSSSRSTITPGRDLTGKSKPLFHSQLDLSSGSGDGLTLWSPPVSPLSWTGIDFSAVSHTPDTTSGISVTRLTLDEVLRKMEEEKENVDRGRRTAAAVSARIRLMDAPRPGVRRTSSLGRIAEVTSMARDMDGYGMEDGMEEDFIQGPGNSPVVRRKRRQAICSRSNLVSPDSEIPSVSTNDASGSTVFRKSPNRLTISHEPQRRKKSSADLGMHYAGDLLTQVIPTFDGHVLFKQNTISHYANKRAFLTSTASLISDQEKKVKSPFSLLKLIDKKSHRLKDLPSNLTEILQNMKRKEFGDDHLSRFKRSQWTDLISDDPRHVLEDLCKAERNRRSAAWELFTSECVFLLDHLLVLKHCFVEPLKQLQVEGFLMFVEPENLFGNLDEVCSVSHQFCVEFSHYLLEEITTGSFCSTEVLIRSLRQLSLLTRNGEVYHDYCLNYSKAFGYLELLRCNEEFIEFEKWCEQDPRCNRLQLSDLLISPMQHCTKVPMLLASICNYTDDPGKRKLLMASLEKLQASLRDLDQKMKWLKNFERIQEIQQRVAWQPITEVEPRIFIPECLRSLLSRQPCERLLSDPNRQLIHEGPVQLLETLTKPSDVYLFLFDDILLLTKPKKQTKKKTVGGSDVSPYKATNQGAECPSLLVHRQPIAIDRFLVHDLTQIAADTQAAGSSPKNSFAVVELTRYQQIVSVYTLQSPSSESKTTWLNKLRECQESYLKKGRTAPAISSPGNGDRHLMTSPYDDVSGSRFRRRAGHRRTTCGHRRRRQSHQHLINPHRRRSRPERRSVATPHENLSSQPSRPEEQRPISEDSCRDDTEDGDKPEESLTTSFSASGNPDEGGISEPLSSTAFSEAKPPSRAEVVDRKALLGITETILV